MMPRCSMSLRSREGSSSVESSTCTRGGYLDRSRLCVRGSTLRAGGVARPSLRNVGKRTAVAILLTVAVGLTGACTSSVADGASARIELLTSEGPPVTFGAEVEGTLVIDVDRGCVVIERSDGTRSDVVFPEGTTLDLSDRGRRAIVMSDLRLIDGQQLRLGGGGIAKADLEEWRPYSHLANSRWCAPGESVTVLSGQ